MFTKTAQNICITYEIYIFKKKMVIFQTLSAYTIYPWSLNQNVHIIIESFFNGWVVHGTSRIC